MVKIKKREGEWGLVIWEKLEKKQHLEKGELKANVQEKERED